MDLWKWTFLVQFAVLKVALAVTELERVCWFTSRSVDNVRVQKMDSGDEQDQEDLNQGHVQGNSTVCSSDYCYALWKEDLSVNGTSVIYIAQGCWESGGKYECESDECISTRKLPKALTNTNFCCCRGNYCNINVSFAYSEVEDGADLKHGGVADPLMTLQRNNTMLVIVLVFLGALSASAMFLVLRAIHDRKINSGKASSEALRVVETRPRVPNLISVENIKFDSTIGVGRYGTVWHGNVGDTDIAIKVFRAHHRQYFYNERDIYCLPFMNHSSLLTYFGCDERTGQDGEIEYLLFLSLAPEGCLQDYLRRTTLDWSTFCKMALSSATGLAYLHTEIRKGDKVKPCLSHRDLNSNNILVKADLSCVICDLGFTTQISGSKYYFNGEEQHAETKSITDVGTLRYMSPEVLEGAVNLRDCESSLKQIDVYAFGLILWELASRCYDFYPPGVECPPYKLPFEVELKHVSLEQMQVLVCRHKARPLFPDLWRDTYAVRTVRETIEDCWDHDAEARLTALCIEERFHELSGSNNRLSKGLSYFTGISLNGGLVPNQQSHNVLAVTEVTAVSEKEYDSCQSESTMDTYIATSPLNCKNSNQLHPYTHSVQPYQGRNPCLERNLMASHYESSSGELIDKSHKHLPSGPNTSDPLPAALPSTGAPALFTPPRPPTLPIPFVQNVGGSEGAATAKKSKLSNVEAGTKECRKRYWWEWVRGRSRRKDAEALIANEGCMIGSTPMEEKSFIKVAITNGKLETKLADDNCILDQNESNFCRPKTLSLSVEPCCPSLAKQNSLKDEGECARLLEDPFRINGRELLKNPNCRVKTPGDVPIEVRRSRGKKNAARFSLYDDRMMSGYDETLISYRELNGHSEIRSSLNFAQNEV